MRVYLAVKDQDHVEHLQALFERHGCVVDTLPETMDPMDIRAEIEYTPPSVAIIDPECAAIFNKAVGSSSELKDHRILKRPLREDGSVFIPHIFAAVANDNGLNIGVTLKSGNVRLNTLQNHCTQDGEAVTLTKTEYKILRTLMLNAGKTLTKQALENALYETPEQKHSNNINKYVAKLRKKLGANFITTSIGNGFSIKHSDSGRIKCTKGPITLFHNNTAKYDDKPLNLEKKQFSILETLIKRPNAVLKACKVQITYIRNVISAVSKSSEYPNGVNVIETVRGQGYRWQEPESRRAKNHKGRPPKGKLDRETGLMITWPSGLSINTRTGEITTPDFTNKEKLYLTPKTCEMLEYTLQNPHWKTRDTETPNMGAIRRLKQKIDILGLDSKTFLKSGKHGIRNSSGYSLIGPFTVREVTRDTILDETFEPDHKPATLDIG